MTMNKSLGAAPSPDAGAPPGDISEAQSDAPAVNIASVTGTDPNTSTDPAVSTATPAGTAPAANTTPLASTATPATTAQPPPTSPPQPDVPASQFYKYAAINFAFYISMSLSGYVTVFLQSIGFDARQVGVVTSLNSGVGVLSSPFWGMLSDKIRSLKKVITITLIIGAVLFALIPISSKLKIGAVAFLFILIPISMFFRSPTMTLIENWMLRNSARERLNYGALRAFGSLSYAIASLALGYILPKTGVEFTFYANAIFVFPALLLLLIVKGSADADAGAGASRAKSRQTFKEMEFGRLLKNYYLVSYIIYSVFQRIPWQCSMIFLPFLVAETGGNTAQMGIIMGLRAFVEIPMMLLLRPLRNRIPLYYIIIAASSFFMLECIMYSFANSFAVIIAISVLHGLGNGLMLPTSSSYVFSLTPDNLKATSQTALASMSAISGILAGLLGGYFIILLGIKQFYLIIGIMIMVALILFILSFIFGEKILGIKRPGLSTG